MDVAEFFRDAPRPARQPPAAGDWWQGVPLPDGTVTAGAHAATLAQVKMWHGLGLPTGAGAWDGLRVLDVGANDGYFSVGAALLGAEVTAVDCPDLGTFPAHVDYAADCWRVAAKVRTVCVDFRALDLAVHLGRFDRVFYLGVLYHLPDPFTPMRQLYAALVRGGVLDLETRLAAEDAPWPFFEYCNDTHPVCLHQGRADLDRVGVSNYLVPNRRSVCHLAESYGFRCAELGRPGNPYTDRFHNRGLFRLRRAADEEG